MSKFYWQDMGTYWAHRGTPQTRDEWTEYRSQDAPSRKVLVRLMRAGSVRLAVGVRDYWLDGTVTYTCINRMDSYASGWWPRLQCWVLDFINERLYP